MSEDEKLLKEAKKLPWEERLAHKNWKVRNDGCIDLASLCDSIVDPKDPRLREFGYLFKKAVADSNAAVQEKALDALIAFLRAADADASRYAKEVCDSIAAKCLTGRPKTVEKAQAAFLLWVELEASEAFLETMEKAIKNKVAKAVVPAIDVMYQALSEFGAKVVPAKRILKMLPELFDHQDQNVRASAKGLTIELCRWIGRDAVKSILFEKMRDTMKKEIESEMDNVTGVSKPTRKIRSEQAREIEQEACAVVSTSGQVEEVASAVPQEIDEYDLVDPVDILTPLSKSTFWEGVKATKWSERRDAVAELTKLSSAKKLAAGDYTEVCRTVKKLITDVNIAVAVEAIQAAGNLANGLRKDFTVCARILLPVLLEKLKEKKQTVIDALMQALQSMHKSGCVSLADVIEDVKLTTKNKVPSVRSGCLNWVTFCIENGPKASAIKLHKDYIPILMECLNDGTPEVRDAAFAALAAFAKNVGMKPLERSLEKLDDVRKKKLTEMIGSTPPSGPVSVAATRAAPNGTVETSEPVVRKSAASLLSGKKPSAHQAAQPAAQPAAQEPAQPQQAAISHSASVVSRRADAGSSPGRRSDSGDSVEIAEAKDPKVCTDGRKDLFEWVTKQMTKHNDLPDLAQLLKPTSVGLQDKSVEVRKAAEACLLELIRSCGYDAVNKAVKGLHGSGLAAVRTVLDRQRSPGSSSDHSDDKGSVRALAGRSGKHASGERQTRAGARSVGSKAAVGKGSRHDAMAAAQDAAVQGQALFFLRDSNKEERERSIPRKFKFEEPRPEQVLEVEADMMRYFREDLHRRLLSPDFKKQVDGLELLQKAIPSHIKEMTELVDVLLRWLVLRFCESNTTCLLKVLDFLPELVEALKNEGYTLTEYEATVFLPCLVEKSGHNIEKVREKMRELMKLLCCIYPASKLFLYICEGLRSKNNRTRIENVDHIGFMIDRYGVEIAGPNKALQSVASLTTERDGDLRKASLQTLATAYKILGDDVWRYLGKLSDAQKSMIDDKFKWKAREMDKRKEGRPGETRAALRRSVRESGIDAVEQSGESASRPITAPPVLRNLRASNAHFEAPPELPFINTSLSPAGPSDWNEALDTIEFGTSAEQVVEGMKIICHELSQLVGDMESNLTDDLIKDADRLVRILTLKVTTTFNMGLGGASSRSCKYVLNTLMQTFQLRKLAHGVREVTLHDLITELLLWLLDERVPLMDDGSQLLKALNVLMLKILENADRTSAFVVLIRLLRPLETSRWPNGSSEEAAAIRGQKFSDLVVKCLIKLTKVLGSTIFEVDLDRLLQSIHEYLQELGMEEIRRRAGADDKPLRMVKTVLHELVKLRGTAIKGHLSMVPIDTEPQPIILAYIDLNLQTLAAARMLTPAGPTAQSQWVDSSGNGPASSPAGHTAEAQLKQELAAVFKKIGDKQTCTIGLYELYRITQLYPQVDIFSQLQNASEAFRTYIRNGLAQMEKSVAAGRAPTSIAMVTPPPASPPSHPSPKAVAMVPVNNPIQPLGLDKNIGNKEEGETEVDSAEIKKPLPSVRTMNYDTVSAPSSGTLDAIRERMRSIQAAAAGSIQQAPATVPVYSRSMSQPETGTAVASPPRNSATAAVAVDDSALTGLQARMERLKSGGSTAALEHLTTTTASS